LGLVTILPGLMTFAWIAVTPGVLAGARELRPTQMGRSSSR